MKSGIRVCAGLVLCLSALTANAQSLRVTVDASGLARVIEQRVFDLKAGTNDLIWEGVSSQLDVGSLQLRNADAPDAVAVVSQRYDFDLASRQALLNRYVGKDVTLVRRDQDGKESERITGKLLSAEGGRVAILQLPDGQLRLDPPGELILSPLVPQGLIMNPRLTFRLQAQEAGKQTLELTYLTRGLSWGSNYNLGLTAEADSATLSGWVILSNSTNLTFANTRWRLTAEEVRKKDALQPVDEKVTVEYRPTGLEGLVTLPMNDSIRLPMAVANEVTVEQRILCDPIGSGPAAPTPPQRLRQVARFVNDPEHGLGIPLPGGRTLVTREIILDEKTQSTTIRPLTDTSIPSTAVGKYFDIALGDAPGLEGERKQTSFRQIADRVQEQDIEIVLRNKTKESARVIAVEHPWGSYEITQKSHEFTKQDDGSIEFPVVLPPGETVTVTYRLRIKY